MTSFGLTGCDEERPLLNSERIQHRFGSYGVEIVRSGPGIRVSNLYSEDASRRTCRTLAITEFVQPVDARVDAVHASILAGGSIGSSLRDAGWEVHKRLTYIGEIPLTDPQSELARLMHVSVPRSLAIHSYDVSVSRSGDHIDYASIVEIHHPEYLDVQQLRAIYGTSADEARPLRLPGDPLRL
ncbi:MAG: hypothetical protein KJO31_00590 [Gammaproteobacteria bacterium]|nr:hypothetical protein [Gammaproteobacteria bacterium]